MTTASDDVILIVNKAIKTSLRSYLPIDVKIRFDLPKDNIAADPSVSVFLYDIQEDLELRTGIPGWQLDPKTKAMDMPLSVNVACKYLFTYWDKSDGSNDDGPDTEPASPAMRTMSNVLNALINTRSIAGVARSHTRIIPPIELQSLGTFWQALGNKPRLCLGYAVTVPLQLLSGAQVAKIQQGKLLDLADHPVPATKTKIK